MKFIITILSLFTLGIQLSSQVPNNVSEPYSVQSKINLDLKTIQSFYFEKPNIENMNSSDIYAVDIETKINILEEGTKIILPNGKKITVIKVKANDAKSLNLSFNNLYLSNNSKMFIYSLDRKQVMGPITRANNNKVFNTHIILSDEVVIEVISDKEANDLINLSNLAYGIKDVEYFLNINDETYNKYSTQSRGCLQSMLDTKHDCNYLTKSSGVNMKQPNCSDFDELEKQKRALCVIISHNSDSNHWEAKGGILINTTSDTSANYCTSYVLTCAHCLTGYFGEIFPYVDPTDIVVRFNWLRKECAIPPNMPNCSDNKAAWEDLINYDEVIDYCDVEIVERDYSNTWPPLSKRVEYAFLKINETLKFKEYFNGWKIHESTASGDRESSILGPWGGNPIEGKVIDVTLAGNVRNITWNLVDTLASGHSGTSLLEGEFLMGIINIKNSASSIGTLYIVDPLAWQNTNPRDILDPDGYYATDFDNGDSIVVEGVERHEKSDCLFSTVECNPTLDLSDYVTPIPSFTEDGDCCFRLEYIDSLDGFVGGDPYGIRIYRDNETQHTLYYDFGSEIFAGDSASYYDPMNDNVIEFCVDPDDLDNDGGKIVIEFQDNNGKIICVKTVEVECLDCCSDENLNIYFESAGDPSDCCKQLIFDIDTVNTEECGFDFVNIFDNIDTSSIGGFDIIRWQDTLFSIPFVFCNYDTVAKQLLVEFYNEDSLLICSKVTTAFLFPCPVSRMVGSGSNDKEEFDITTKDVKQEEITFEYDIKEDEKIEIELFNKYGISQGVILDKESKKGTNEFKFNIEKYKSDIYVFKMKGKKDTVLRTLIIE